MVKNIKAILFDLYDTLLYVETEGLHDARRRVAERLGISHEVFLKTWRKDRLERMRGTKGALAEQFGALAADLGVSVSSEELRSFADWYGGALYDGAHPYPHTREVLAEMRVRGYKLGLVSNCTSPTEKVLEKTGVLPCFDTVALSHICGLLKPEPPIFLKVCDELGVTPEECLFVADGGFGELDGAHAMGMLTVRITQEKQSSDFGSSLHADYQIHDICELLGLLDELRERERDDGGTKFDDG